MLVEKPRLKICGLTSPKAAFEIAKMGVDFIGLIFHPASKRSVTLSQSIAIAEAAQKGGAKPVGVFVDQDADAIQTICEKTAIHIVQCHGKMARAAQPQLNHYTRINVIPVSAIGKQDPTALAYLNVLDPHKDYLLYDNLMGGSGQPIPYHLLKPASTFRSFIAGGITPNNVNQILSSQCFYGVDLASGVEKSPGIKDFNKVSQLLTILKRNSACHS